MTHDEYIKRRDEVIEGLKLASDWEYEGGYKEDMPKKALTTPQARQAIDELMLAVIGLNTQGVIRTGGVMDWKKEGAMNTVRNEQRSIVKGGE